MQDPTDAIPQVARREPWNRGKLIGAKPPLRLKHVWSIRTKLQISGRTRDLAMFNLAIDSKLRGCDVVALKVEDVAPRGYAIDRATVRQKKTGQPVRFELTGTLARRSMTIFGGPAGSPGSSSSQAGAGPIGPFQRGSTRGSSRCGSPILALTRAASAHIRSAEPRPA